MYNEKVATIRNFPESELDYCWSIVFNDASDYPFSTVTLDISDKESLQDLKNHVMKVVPEESTIKGECIYFCGYGMFPERYEEYYDYYFVNFALLANHTFSFVKENGDVTKYHVGQKDVIVYDPSLYHWMVPVNPRETEADVEMFLFLSVPIKKSDIYSGKLIQNIVNQLRDYHE